VSGVLVGAGIVIVLSILVIWWARACARGTLKRNPWVGYRTPLIMSSDQVWVAAHRAAAPLMLVAGIGGIVGAVVGAVLGVAGAISAAPIFLISATGWLVVLLIAGFFPAYARALRAG
jgi:uncharacterized membrane protein